MGSADNVGKKPQIKWADFERVRGLLSILCVLDADDCVAGDAAARLCDC
jgi:hypothetical protein